MISPQSVLHEFDALIAQAESFEVEPNPKITSSHNWVQDRVQHHRIVEPIVRDVQGFEQWKYQVAIFVDHALPPLDATKLSFVMACRSLRPSGLQSTIGRLRGLRESFARGYYHPLQQRVYAEVGGTYLNEAEELLSSVDKSDLKEANTACLYAGIALETQLVSLCAAANIDTKRNDGQRKKAAELLELLKNTGTVDANTAKRLHTYLELRNQSAHGNWDQVSEIAVKEMIVGVRGLVNG